MMDLTAPLPSIVDLETLDGALAGAPSLGARRLLRITQQLASELERAHRLGVVPEDFTVRCVLLEHPDTPFERVRIPYWSEPSTVRGCVRAQLKQVGVWLYGVLAAKPLYLDSPVSLHDLHGAPRALTSRADLEVLRALSRGLRAIAKRCEGGAVAYASAGALARDLARLAALTNRVAGRLRQTRSSLLAHYPKAVASAPRLPLPKVILNHGSSRHEAYAVECGAGR
jgi:hypothetical protein